MSRPATKTAFDRIHAVLRRIPRGRVVTYGQVALLAGVPRAPRMVVQALHRCGDTVPWHRVIGKVTARFGQIRIKVPLGAALQRRLLRREGVEVDREGRIDLERYGWID